MVESNHTKPHVNEEALQAPSVSQIDTMLPPESLYTSASERLTAKLELVMKDPDLALELGGYVSQLALPAREQAGELTIEQVDRVQTAYRETLHATLTPGQREAANKATEHEVWAENQGRRKISDFARL